MRAKQPVKREARPLRKQPTPVEVTNDLLELVRAKFYVGQGVEFAKERGLLLQWVILWPAKWLNERGVTIAVERYKGIVEEVILEAAKYSAEEIKFRPAYLGKAVQSHFAVHGEKYYEEGKSVRALSEAALVTALATGKAIQPKQETDGVREMAQTQAILEAGRAKRVAAKKTPVKQQLSLF